jgi:hypothetical protein
MVDALRQAAETAETAKTAGTAISDAMFTAASTALADFLLHVGPHDWSCGSRTAAGQLWAGELAADAKLAGALAQIFCDIQCHLSHAKAGAFMVPAVGWFTHVAGASVTASSECGRWWLQLLHGAVQDCYSSSDVAGLDVVTVNALTVFEAVGAAHAVYCADFAATWLRCLHVMCMGLAVQGNCPAARAGYVALVPAAARLLVRFVDVDSVVDAFMHLSNDVVWEDEDAACVAGPLAAAARAVVTWRGAAAAAEGAGAACKWGLVTLATAAEMDPVAVLTADGVQAAGAATAALLGLPRDTSEQVLLVYVGAALQVVDLTLNAAVVVDTVRTWGLPSRAALARAAAAATELCARVEAFCREASCRDPSPQFATRACALKQQMYAVFEAELVHQRLGGGE